MKFHWLRLRASSHPSEDPTKVKKALQSASALDDEVFAQLLQETEMDSHHGAKQSLYDLEMKRAREIRACLGQFIRGGHEETLDARMDDDGVVYFRLDKQAAFGGEIVEGRFDDPISVRVKVQVHPFSREGALSAWSEQFKELS